MPAIKKSIKHYNVWPSTDLVLHSTVDGVKEDIVINEYTGQNRFDFKLNVENVRYEKFDGSGYKFYNLENGNLEFIVPPFYAWDSSGPAYTGACKYLDETESEISKMDDGYMISIILNKAISPTIYFTHGI